MRPRAAEHERSPITMCVDEHTGRWLLMEGIVDAVLRHPLAGVLELLQPTGEFKRVAGTRWEHVLGELRRSA